MKLTRTAYTDQGTFGVLEGEGLRLFTLECPWRDNRRMVSCIPEGRYDVVWGWSNRFKRNTFRLVGVLQRDGILIHSANFAGDQNMGWVSQLNGCIALGLRQGILRNRNGAMQNAILSSSPAVRQFEKIMPKKFKLEIVS